MGGVRMEPGGLTVYRWIGRIETALGLDIYGGARAAVREVLMDAFEYGLSYNGDLRDREDGTNEPAKGSPSASEIVDAYEDRVSAPRSTEAKEDPEASDSVSALRGWWEQTAYDEVSQLVAKMTEYGGLSRATDLTEIGRDLVAAGVSKGPLIGNGAVQDGWLQELGIYFYVRGKFARWQAAIIEGRPVSDDTLLDLGIYVRMAQRVRAVGGWPV